MKPRKNNPIRRFRAAERLTMREASEWLNVSEQQIQHFETEYTKPPLYVMAYLSQYFGEPIPTLFDYVIKKELESRTKRGDTSCNKSKIDV